MSEVAAENSTRERVTPTIPDLLSPAIRAVSEDVASSVKWQLQKVDEAYKLVHMFGHLVKPFFAWDELGTLSDDDRANAWWSARGKRWVRVNINYSTIHVNLYLGKEDEYGEVNELVEIFEAGMMLEDVDFTAPADFEVSTGNKTRTLRYKMNENTKDAFKCQIIINVVGEHSDKCIVVTETTDEVVPAHYKTRSRLVCAGDPEYAELTRKEDDTERLGVVPEPHSEDSVQHELGTQLELAGTSGSEDEVLLHERSDAVADTTGTASDEVRGEQSDASQDTDEKRSEGSASVDTTASDGVHSTENDGSASRRDTHWDIDEDGIPF